MNARRLIAACCGLLLISAVNGHSVGSELADAAMNRDMSSVRSLLQHKADVNAPQADGATALHWAAQLDDLAMADLLIQAGANVKAKNRFDVTPLAIACLNGSAAMIEKLIKAGADANATLSALGEAAVTSAT